ncbi:SGNH/GDSL hydrolase family protein [Paraburkholderia sediminicola]|uniref:SGNH/GDSL hydrolase family protein n=1 Tax=Paraburkholderia sediminicola TaxID=458836 RepID=UPI0038BD5B81
MKGIAAAFAGVFVMACSGCGGIGGGSPAVTQTARAAPKVVAIDAEGDSTMVGGQVINGVPGVTANNPPALLQKSFGNNAKVIKSAIGGSRVPQALDGTPPRYVAPLASRLASLSPNIVLSNFGINDAEFGNENLYHADLIAWISTVRSMGAIPILEEPNPVCDATHPKLDTFVGILRSVAAAQGVTLISQYDYIKSLPNWQAMLTDCVHPYDSLYQIKAQREYAVLAPIVKAMQ